MITKERLQKWMENYPATIDLKKKAKKKSTKLYARDKIKLYSKRGTLFEKLTE